FAVTVSLHFDTPNLGKGCKIRSPVILNSPLEHSISRLVGFSRAPLHGAYSHRLFVEPISTVYLRRLKESDVTSPNWSFTSARISMAHSPTIEPQRTRTAVALVAFSAFTFHTNRSTFSLLGCGSILTNCLLKI